jgi:flavodoxin
MESFIVFDSQYGNTEQIARAVAEVFGEAGQVHIVRADRASALHLSEADLLAVGGPTQRHGLSPALAQLLENIPGGVLNGVAAVAFDTRLRYPAWLSGSAAAKIGKALERAGCTLVAEPTSFFVTGSEGPLEQGEYERAVDWARMVAARAEGLGQATAQT